LTAASICRLRAGVELRRGQVRPPARRRASGDGLVERGGSRRHLSWRRHPRQAEQVGQGMQAST
jgi:hypothetical protein